MADVESQVSGLEDLENKLRNLLSRKARAAIRRSVNAGAEIFRGAIVAADPKKTWFLKGHELIVTKTSTKDGSVVARVGPEMKVGYFVLSESGRGKMKGGEPHYPSLYAYWLEFGTKHQPASPVMGPAFENNKDRVLGVFIADLNAELAKV